MARVHFLNVEEGDCSIIQHDNGDVTMIDVCSAKAPEPDLVKGMKTFSDASESVSIPKGNFHQKPSDKLLSPPKSRCCGKNEIILVMEGSGSMSMIKRYNY